MKLLFDQNISFRVLKLLSDSSLQCQHVRMVGLNNCDDIIIWSFAKNNDYAIVTLDADFSDISTLRGSPPKIIWLRTGNLGTNEIAEKIICNYSIIINFLVSFDQNCLEIF